jgi:NADPH:quinone reductase-like Zn-dependent oxidoreductase
MRAVVLTGHGGPEVLQVQDRLEPPVGAGEVRIDVRAAGVNFADTAARVGVYPDAPKPPCVLGYEVAGVVDSVGEGVEWPSANDRVVAEAGPGDFIYVPPYVPHQEINASPDDSLSCVVVRSGQEPVVVNLDMPAVEPNPEQIHWVDDIHKEP